MEEGIRVSTRTSVLAMLFDKQLDGCVNITSMEGPLRVIVYDTKQP